MDLVCMVPRSVIRAGAGLGVPVLRSNFEAILYTFVSFIFIRLLITPDNKMPRHVENTVKLSVCPTPLRVFPDS